MAYTWPDGSRGHSIPWAQHDANMKAAERARQQENEQRIKTASQNRAPGTAGSAVGILGSNSVAGPGAPDKGLIGASQDAPAEPPPPPRKPFEYVPDSGFNNQVAINKQRYDTAIGDLDNTERRTRFEFGFDDPTNAFSRQTEMRRLFLAQTKGTEVSMNNRGQLTSGANLRAIARNKRNEDKASADLRAAYEAALDVIRHGRTTAKTDREEADERARRESYERQLAAYNAS